MTPRKKWRTPKLNECMSRADFSEARAVVALANLAYSYGVSISDIKKAIRKSWVDLDTWQEPEGGACAFGHE
jgi:hypothetical protein